jgi:hypothetical protein
MKKMQVMLMALLISAGLFSQRTINDPNVQVRDVSGFEGIRVSSAFDVYITQADKDAVAVSASKIEYRDRIITKVENGILVIRIDDEKNFWKGWNSDKRKLTAYISVKKLEKLNVSGACEVYFEDGIAAESLSISFSGASDLNGKVDVKSLSVNISGASDITLSGNAETVSVEASGASDFKGFDLKTNFCEAKTSGASSVSITVNKELSAKASGASNVRYKGEGLIRDIKTSGSSNVSRRS